MLPLVTCPGWATAEPGTPCDENSGLPRAVTDKATGIEMVLVPPGTFMMGISPGDPEVDPETDYEQPTREVRIANAFYLGKYEVTNAQWRLVRKNLPRRAEGGDEHPVIDVSWKDAQGFMRAAGFRLPTDAEWEYSCRAGTKGPRYGPLDDVASWWPNTGGSTVQVGLKKPNGFGLCDMLGNVWEWCSDSRGETETGDSDRKAYDAAPRETLRTLRGGGSRDRRTYWLRASISAYQIESYRNLDLGFRVARDP
jgi:formylglycine-generating enzyme required for sulfatase activity